MTKIETLVDTLGAADPNERAKALAELVGAGREATSALIAALARTDPSVRVQAAQALAEVADPGAEQAYTELLGDPEPAVRARGAQGLAAIGSPRAIDALVRTIDDLPDLLHFPSTLAVQALIARGPKAAVAVAPLLQAPSPVTRERAVLVLRSLAGELPGPPELGTALARYNAYADEAERKAAAEEIIRLVGA
jgi:HEAT repeat protein